jgi:hypothetical protein
MYLVVMSECRKWSIHWNIFWLYIAGIASRIINKLIVVLICKINSKQHYCGATRYLCWLSFLTITSQLVVCWTWIRVWDPLSCLGVTIILCLHINAMVAPLLHDYFLKVLLQFTSAAFRKLRIFQSFTHLIHQRHNILIHERFVK